jgi:hypothetical protein
MISSSMAKNAEEVCRRLELTRAARALLGAGMSPEEFVAVLRKKRHDLDAFLVLAHWLPKRESVWWGCLCVWHLCEPSLEGPEDAALAATVRWVQDTSEANRRACEKAAEQTGLDTLSGCLAMAAFASGGSMSAPRLPDVAPPTTFTATVLSRGLFAVAAALRPRARAQQRSEFFELGVQVAHHKLHWTDPALATVRNI